MIYPKSSAVHTLRLFLFLQAATSIIAPPVDFSRISDFKQAVVSPIRNFFWPKDLRRIHVDDLKNKFPSDKEIDCALISLKDTFFKQPIDKRKELQRIPQRSIIDKDMVANLFLLWSTLDLPNEKKNIELEKLDECPICLNSFEAKSFETKSNIYICAYCNKTFHESCISKWHNTNTSCPLCRHEDDVKKVNLSIVGARYKMKYDLAVTISEITKVDSKLTHEERQFIRKAIKEWHIFKYENPSICKLIEPPSLTLYEY